MLFNGYFTWIQEVNYWGDNDILYYTYIIYIYYKYHQLKIVYLGVSEKMTEWR